MPLKKILSRVKSVSHQALKGIRDPLSVISVLLRNRQVSQRTRELSNLFDSDSRKVDQESLTPIHRRIEAIDVTWAIPYFSKNSGGHRTIFRFARHLEALGIVSHFVLTENPFGLDDSQVKKQIESWFFPIKGQVSVKTESLALATALIATDWKSAYLVKRYGTGKKVMYFVQDFEPWFFPRGTEYALALDSYSWGFPAMTAGSWLASTIQEITPAKVDYFNFAADPLPESLPKTVIRDRKRVFFYARPETERRGFELGMLSLALLFENDGNVEIHLAGSELVGVSVGFPHVLHGVVDELRLREIMSECDIALVISFTNVSLMPVELMSLGVPVVSNRGEWLEWQLNSENASLSLANPVSISQTISNLLKNKEHREKLRVGGFAYASKFSWEAEAEKLASFIRALPVFG